MTELSTADRLDRLSHGAVNLAASESFRSGDESLDFTPCTEPVPYAVDLANFRWAVNEARRRFPRPVESDSWLASRLHASLRLNRRQAADRGIWRYLGLVAAPDYVRWRWGRDSTAATLERFVGEDRKHALARLWWGAELFRDGPDYTPVETAFRYQDFPNSVLQMGLAHHRPAGQALLQLVVDGERDGHTVPDVIRAFAPALNSAATTVLLDALASDPALDGVARRRWSDAAPEYDVRTDFDAMPKGPDDPTVPVKSVHDLRQLLEELTPHARYRDR
jgi:hypothetical protein